MKEMRKLLEEDPDTPVTTVITTIDGCRLLHMGNVSTLFDDLLCPKCKKATLKLTEKSSYLGTIGLNSYLEVFCKHCDKIVCRAKSSATIGGQFGQGKAESNIRAVLSARNCGFGYDKLVRFFAGINVPRPMHLKTYQRMSFQAHAAGELAVEESLATAAKAVRDRYKLTDDSVTDDSILPIGVSYDGTWHKRGYSSHYGIGIVIEMQTGLVLDYHVMSNYCQGCLKAPKEAREYQIWERKHAGVCQKNYDGSAPSMEVEAAKVIFARSLERYNIKYTTMLCDGDAKSIEKLNDMNVYDEPVSKEDCVNHIAKRLYTGIENLKKKLRGTADSISGGKGKLTEKLQKRLTNYYAQALRENAPDIKAMREGAYASVMHMMSTDEAPQHELCPPGETS